MSISKNEFLRLQNDTLSTLDSSPAVLAESLNSFCAMNKAAEDAAAARKNAGIEAVQCLQGMFAMFEEAEAAKDYIAALWIAPNLPSAQRDALSQSPPSRRDKSESANALRKARKAAQDKISQYASRLIDRAFPAAPLTLSEKAFADAEKAYVTLLKIRDTQAPSDFPLADALASALHLLIIMGGTPAINEA